MQPVNCFWVGLGVCSSYHSEKEKESFIVEEKKKTAKGSVHINEELPVYLL